MEFDNYIIHETMQGGLSDIYICTLRSGKENSDEYKFVLKTFQKQFFYTPEIRQAFIQECINWTKLSHIPNILPVIKFDMVKGQPYLVLPFVHADQYGCTTLSDIIHNRLLDTSLIVKFTFQLALALKKASLVIPELIHGDLKPDNLFIIEQNLHIADFGLSRTVRDNFNYFGHEQYRAPEAWDSSNLLTPKIDIYSFGLILYQMLMNAFPFQGNADANWQELHLYSLPQIPDALPRSVFVQQFFALYLELNEEDYRERIKGLDLPDEEIRLILLQLSLQCLDKKPDGRPQDFSYIAEVINRIAQLNSSLLFEHFMVLREMALSIKVTGNYFLQHGYIQTLQTLIKLNMPVHAKAELSKIPSQAYNDQLWHLSGTIHSLIGDDETALVHLDIAYHSYTQEQDRNLCLIEKGLSLKRLKRYSEAESIYNDLLKKLPTEHLNNLITNFATVYVEWGKMEEAAGLLENYLRRHTPKTPHIWVNLGVVYSHQGKGKQAIAAFEKALQVDPNLAMVHINTSEILINQFQNYHSAIHHLEAAWNLGCRQGNLYFMLAESYSNLFEFKKAEQYFNLIERNIDEAGFKREYYCYTKSFYHICKHEYSQALQFIEEALGFAPENSRYLIGKAKLLEHLKDYSGLETCLNRLLELNPGNQQISTWLTEVQAIHVPTPDPSPTTSDTIPEIDFHNFSTILLIRWRKYCHFCCRDMPSERFFILSEHLIGLTEDNYKFSDINRYLKDQGMDLEKCSLYLYFAAIVFSSRGRMDLAVLLLEEGLRLYPDFSEFYFVLVVRIVDEVYVLRA